MKKNTDTLKMLIPIIILLILLIPICSASNTIIKKPVDLPPTWGPIFKATCNASYEWYGWTNSTIVVPVFSYKIVGIGDHNIEYTMSYNLSFYDGTWKNASYTLHDGLFFILNPLTIIALLINNYKPWKIVAQNRFTFPQDNLKAGSWSIKVNIDDSKFIEDTYILNPN